MVDESGNQHEISFRTVWNAFVGMYQILSSENWTSILYSVTGYEAQYHMGWISAILFMGWFMLANSEPPIISDF